MVSVAQEVKFDAVRRRTKLQDWCPGCCRYRRVSGAAPVFLLPGEVVPEDRLVRTDLEFGTGDELGPFILVGISLAGHLAQERLSGLTLKPMLA